MELITVDDERDADGQPDGSTTTTQFFEWRRETMDWQVFQGIMTKKLSSCDPKADLIKAFKTFDRQGDGTLSADELSQVMKTLGEMLTDEEVEEMIRDADPQKTGRVQYTAFVDQLVSGR